MALRARQRLKKLDMLDILVVRVRGHVEVKADRGLSTLATPAHSTCMRKALIGQFGIELMMRRKSLLFVLALPFLDRYGLLSAERRVLVEVIEPT